jgi:predicted ester cyclase
MELNVEIVRQLYQEVTSRRRSDHIVKTGNNGFTQYTVSAKPSNLKAFYSFFANVAEAFPDYELNLNSLIVKGDRVMARYTISGTHKGNFMGLAATNERMAIAGIDVFRLDKGQVIEHWDAAHQITASPLSSGENRTPPGSWRPGGVITTPSSHKQLSFSV